MGGTNVWFALCAVNAVAYIAFIKRRGEGGLYWTSLVALVLGPLVWFLWLSARAGRRRSE
ncbi:MAG: hypothetical protein QOE58_777 [Actinomycetota bacterium]|jgi:hypothetical protein|nr:hypothetical protein [Actinomycetota bacterium]